MDLTKTKNLIINIYKAYLKNDVSARAAQFTYYLLLSFIPFIILLINILSHIDIDTSSFMQDIYLLLPTSVYTMILSIISTIKIQSSFTYIPLTIIFILWVSSRGIFALITGLNKSYKVKETRSYIKLSFLALCFTLIFILIIITSLFLMVFGDLIINTLSNYFNMTYNFFYTVNIIRSIIFLFTVFATFLLLFKFAPNVHLKLKEVIPGAIFSTITWTITSIIFTLYVNNFGNFTNMYGSLSNIIVLMFWLYISNTLIILGGELNSHLKDKNL